VLFGGVALSGVHEFRQVELKNAGSLRAQRFGILAFLNPEVRGLFSLFVLACR